MANKKRQKGKQIGNDTRADARREAFVLNLLADPTYNATAAAKKAGFPFPSQDAYRLLKDPDIAERVAAHKKARNERLEIDADNVVRELLRIAFFDIGEAFDESGRLKDLKDMPVEIRRVIAGIEVFEEYQGRGEDRKLVGFTKKIKLPDKAKVLEILTKHVKVRELFPNRVEVSGPDGGDIPMGNTEMANRLLSLLTKLEDRAKKGAGGAGPAGS